jgi:TonB-linked SusC/RagA family outer membrane protein
MKKTLRDCYRHPTKQNAGIQQITIMLTLLIASLSMFQVQAADTVSKGERISISFEETSLKEAFIILENKTPYRFFYNHKAINTKRKINLKLSNAPIHIVVAELLKGSDISYKIKGDQIVLRKHRHDVASLDRNPDPDIDRSSSSDDHFSTNDADIPGYVHYELAISGKVQSDAGESLPGVSVLVKGTNTGTVTDADGKYMLSVPDEQAQGTLVFSFIGYMTQEVAISGRTTVDIIMQPDVQTLSEVVVVGYGTQKKESLTGAISSVGSKELESVHAVTTSAMLAGKIPGLSFRQADGRPGSSAVVQIRNMGSPLFVIDGIQKDEGQFNNISPNDIESISILKDASASVYGSRAANGVVIVTTKKGKLGSGNTLSLDAYTGWQSWSRFPKTVDAGEWMTAKVDADVNEGRAPELTAEELAKWQAGTEEGYRSFDWYKFIIRENAPQTSINVNATGGSDKISYYMSLGRIDQSSVLGRQYTFARTNIQSNIDVQITDRFKVGTQINGRIETRDQPGIPYADDYWLPRFALFRNRPTERPYANDNPDYPADIGHNETNWAILNKKISGYWREDWRVLQTNFNAEYQTPLKGLTAKGMFSYYMADRIMNGHEYTYDAYTYNKSTDEYIRTGGSTNPWRERGTRKVLENVTQGHLNYNRTFSKHTVGVTFVAERIERRDIEVWVHTVPKTNVLPILQFSDMDTYNDVDREEARAGYVGRITYDYAGKYLIEIAGRRDASWKFAPEKRWGFFPSVSAGWRISEEPFYRSWTGVSNVLSDLKLRASYGELGDDNLGLDPFAYRAGYNYGTSTVILDGEVIKGGRDRGVPVRNISWFASKMTDIGIDFGLFNGKLSGTLDYFYRKRSGLLGVKTDILLPSELGYGLPIENVNSDAQLGGEASIAYNGNVGDVRFTVGGNISYSRGRILESYKPELNWGNSWDKYRGSREHRWTGTIWGYQAIGQFKSKEEIANYPVNIDGEGNKSLLPGDIIYKDVNGDKKIDYLDERPIGFARDRNPILNYGIHLTMNWRNFDLRADFSGGSMYSYIQNWEMRVPFQNTGNLLREFYENRWHRADPYDPNSEWIAGKYPALRFNAGGHSNYRHSDFWLTNVRYLRLRTFEVGYTLPADLISKVKLKRARVYVNTFNLFSLDNLKHLGIEPEIMDENGLQYPQNKLINVGVNLSF